MVKYLNQCSSGYINIVSFHFLFMKVFWNRPKAFSLFVDKFFWGSRDRNKYYFQCVKYVKTCRNRKHSMPAKRSTGAIYRFQPSSELFEKVDEPKTGFLNLHHHSALSVGMLWTILFHTYRSDIVFARSSLSFPGSIPITYGIEIFL